MFLNRKNPVSLYTEKNGTYESQRRNKSIPENKW